MKKFYKNPLVMMVIGTLIVGASSIGAAQAALNAYSESNNLEFSTGEFGVEITQDGDPIDGAISFEGLEEDGNIKIGKTYKTSVEIKNTSDIYDNYVRAIVRKSWQTKVPDVRGLQTNRSLDPNLIKITVDDAWEKYEGGDYSDEYEVYYLPTALKSGTTQEFIKGFTIDDKVIEEYTTEETETSIRNVYTYNEGLATISVQIDAIQGRHAKDAIYSSWGMIAECTEDEDGNVIGPITLK